MSNMRIGGLASGMDIDQIVGDLMKAERMPLDKLKQKKQILEWQRDDYRSMNSLLFSFRTEISNMKYTTNYRARSVTSTNSDLITATASSAASKASYTISEVKSLAKAASQVSGSISKEPAKIDPAKSLSSQESNIARITSATWDTGYVGSQTLKGDGPLKLTLNNGEKVNLAETSKMTVKVNGETYQFIQDPAATLTDKQVRIDADGNLAFGGTLQADATIKVDYILEQKIEEKTLTGSTSSWNLGKTDLSVFSLDVTKVGDTVPTTYNPTADLGNGVFALEDSSVPPVRIGKINMNTGEIIFEPAQPVNTKLTAKYEQDYSFFNLGTETSKGTKSENFLVSGSESLNNVISRVNNSNVGITMFYDSVADKVSLTRTETGNFQSNGQLSNDTTIDQIKVSGEFATDVLYLDSAAVNNGENAEFVINEMTTWRSSNTFEMNGVTFTLKQKFDITTQPVSLSISNDTNKVFDNIKAFVEKYNELIDKIQTKTNEQYYRDYKPLTDEQRETLSDKMQEQWEEKAKSGLLRRDPILTQVLGNMRNDFYAPVENDTVNSLFNQLATIGITTTNIYQQGGKLEIKEDVLKKAIEDNPDSVENLFRGTGDTKSEQGILNRLYDTITGSLDKLRARAGNSNSSNKNFTLGRQLDNVYSQIDRFEDRLTQVEDRYWRQFTAMEKAIQRSNSQSMYLMQQFSM